MITLRYNKNNSRQQCEQRMEEAGKHIAAAKRLLAGAENIELKILIKENEDVDSKTELVSTATWGIVNRQ